MLFGGLLIGVLLARTIAGAIGGWLGWRAMYVWCVCVCVSMCVCGVCVVRGTQHV